MILLWILIEIIIRPLGEFPLNDDWSYTRSLENLYRLHSFSICGFTSMPLIAQLGWGMLFCRLFGFSFFIVRLSTIVLGLVGVLCSYGIVKELTGNNRLAFFTGLIVLVNPLYLNLANSFMTDVPFAAALWLSVYCLLKGMRGAGRRYILWGVFFCICATLIRQLGLLVIVSWALVVVVKDSWSRKSLLMAAGGVAAVVVSYLVYNSLLYHYSGRPLLYDEGFNHIRMNFTNKEYPLPFFLTKQVFGVLVYSGLFILPLLFLFRVSRRMLVWYALTVLVVLGYCVGTKKVMPFFGNIINPAGVGVTDLRDTMILHLPNTPLIAHSVWVLVTVAGAIGAGLLAVAGVQAIRYLRRLTATVKAEPGVVFLVAFLVLYLGVMLVGGTFDRYLLPMLPLLCALVGMRLAPAISFRPLSIGIALTVLVVFAVVSVGETYNYFSWNRARWEALHYLTDEQHLPPTKIDGGPAFNGYYLFDDTYDWQEDPARKSWWWVKDDEWLVSFGPVAGYRVVKEYPYRRWMGAASGTICILQRIN
ncbi:ArnT family glycosyltransferase [Puia dinghuensis]|uniref:ArnT family glycosyltransferase n=1 Tax=Puia dinghuensis TaxID=1792502 RepID=UPI0016631442|nr:glycosyltransferase family 39 protein [Puia dinghuensis]